MAASASLMIQLCSLDIGYYNRKPPRYKKTAQRNLGVKRGW